MDYPTAIDVHIKVLFVLLQFQIMSFYSKNHKIYHGLEFERENENNVLFKEQKPWAIKLRCLGSCTPKGSLGVLEEVYLQHLVSLSCVIRE